MFIAAAGTRVVRRLLVGVLTGSAALFVVFNGATIAAAGAGLRQASVLPAAAGLVLSVAAMANRGLLNRAAHEAVGLSVAPAAMARTTAVGFAANKIVKSGGVSGLTVFLRHGRRRGFAQPTVTASCVVAAAASFAALGTLLAVTIALLGVSGRLSGWWLAAAIGFGLYSATIALVGYAASRSRETARRLWAWIRRRRPMSGRRVDAGAGSGVDDLYDALANARMNKQWSRRAYIHAVASKSLGAAMLIAATGAAGVRISLSEAVIIYTTALSASVVSIVPGGVGAVEASTGAMLVGTGAPIAVAGAAVALFRVFDLWLPVVTGAWLGRHELRESRARGDETAPSIPPVALARA